MISEVKCGITEKKKYELSVLILTYEPCPEKVLMTIASVINQKKVSLQIVISDDGSLNPGMQDYVHFMELKGFDDYKIVLHEHNEGTVINFADALSVSEGDYVKSLGPGDCFSSPEIVRLWLDYMECKKSKMSFCNSLYYTKCNGQYESVVEVAHPQRTELSRMSKAKRKKYYLLLNDIFLAASILCERKMMYKYAQIILGKAKYAEDNMFRIMILNGEEYSFFDYEAVFYEWGSGISTSGDSEFGRKIKEDWDAITTYICEHCGNTCIEKEIKYYYDHEAASKSFKGRVYNCLAKLNIYICEKQAHNRKKLTNKGCLEYLYVLKECVDDHLGKADECDG